MKNTSLDKIIAAFNDDGFAVHNFSTDDQFKKTVAPIPVNIGTGGSLELKDQNGNIIATGIMATRPGIEINGKKRTKKAFYVDGTFYGMGYLISLMAADDVYDMAYHYLDNIIPDFLKENPNPNVKKEIGKALKYLCKQYIKLFINDVPQQYQDEITGLHDGLLQMKKDQPHDKLSDSLYALNFGIDLLLANIYSGWIVDAVNNLSKILDIGIIEKRPEQFKVPIMCNAFSIKGRATGDNHYFGRDFMFSTGGYFQDTACMIIYNPEDPKYPDIPAVPTVSQTAPGFIGSVTAMNLKGIAAGTDMNPTKMCNPAAPGFNSLGLVRHCVQNSQDMENLIKAIQNATRGVSWFYPAADGQSGRACFIEAGKSTDTFPYFDYFDKNSPYLIKLKNAGLDDNYINKHQNTAPIKGTIVRENDYEYPADYYQFNKILIDTYNSINKTKIPYINTDETGYINKTAPVTSPNYPGTDDQNCPATYFFAPQRENHKDLLIVTNSNISPEMRLTAMNNWIEGLAGNDMNDIQWRYDELNNELLTAIKAAESGGPLIDDKKARQIIDFRAHGKADDTIHGSVSLCDLKKRIISSHYGYNGDPWITITLPNYFL